MDCRGDLHGRSADTGNPGAPPLGRAQQAGRVDTAEGLTADLSFALGSRRSGGGREDQGGGCRERSWGGLGQGGPGR